MFEEQYSQTSQFVLNTIVKIVDEKGNFAGSGFFISMKGRKYCITCHHCIYKLDKMMIEKSSKNYLLRWNEKYSDI